MYIVMLSENICMRGEISAKTRYQFAKTLKVCKKVYFYKKIRKGHIYGNEFYTKS